MAQFTDCRSDRASSTRVPYLLDVQSDLLHSGSRRVVPLVREVDDGARHSRLNPTFEVEGIGLVAAVSDLAAVDERQLREAAADLSRHRQVLLDALDFLFTGH